MNVSIIHLKKVEGEELCMHCHCRLDVLYITALLNEQNEHTLYLYSCPQCPNLTFEFSNDRDLAVLNHYLLEGYSTVK